MGLTLFSSRRQIIAEKAMRLFQIKPDEIIEIRKKCPNCGSGLFCIKVFQGTVDPFCSFVHLCPSCSFKEQHDTFLLRREEIDKVQCLICNPVLTEG